MGVAVIFLGIVLCILLVCISAFLIRKDDEIDVYFLWLIFFMSVVFGMGIERCSTVSVSKYLEHPENYQVDTFMVNGVIDHYEVSNK